LRRRIQFVGTQADRVAKAFDFVTEAVHWNDPCRC
jgi:hypothetical protein